MFWKLGTLQQSDTNLSLKSHSLSQEANGKKACYPSVPQLAAEQAKLASTVSFSQSPAGAGGAAHGRGQARCVTGTQAWERKNLKIGENIMSDSQKRGGYKYKLHLDSTCSNCKCFMKQFSVKKQHY